MEGFMLLIYMKKDEFRLKIKHFNNINKRQNVDLSENGFGYKDAENVRISLRVKFIGGKISLLFVSELDGIRI